MRRNGIAVLRRPRQYATHSISGRGLFACPWRDDQVAYRLTPLCEMRLKAIRAISDLRWSVSGRVLCSFLPGFSDDAAALLVSIFSTKIIMLKTISNRCDKMRTGFYVDATSDPVVVKDQSA
jgi:hypothetical protein